MGTNTHQLTVHYLKKDIGFIYESTNTNKIVKYHSFKIVLEDAVITLSDIDNKRSTSLCTFTYILHNNQVHHFFQCHPEIDNDISSTFLCLTAELHDVFCQRFNIPELTYEFIKQYKIKLRQIHNELTDIVDPGWRMIHGNRDLDNYW